MRPVPPPPGRPIASGSVALACLLLPAMPACDKNIAPLEDLDARPATPSRGLPGEHPHGMPTARGPTTGSPPASAEPAWTVSGTVTLAPELADRVAADAVLFVFAREPGSRVPAAADRIPAPRFPVEFVLAAGHGGAPDEAPPPRLEVLARVSRGGAVGPPQPGDLEGRSREPVAPRASGVLVTIDSVVGSDGGAR